MAGVAIIDDDALFRELLTDLADMAGIEVMAQGASLDDLDRVLATKPDLLLLDLNLPEGSSEPFVAKAAKSTQVVMLTGDTDVDTAQRLRSLGARMVLLKSSIELDTLQDLLDGLTND